MIAALLPVKMFARSKERLGGLFTPVERELLARAMFEDVWATLRAARCLDGLLVISAEPHVLVRCREENVACWEEAGQHSHSDSVNRATGWAISLGVTSLVSVAIDTPAVTAEEIATLVGLARRYAVVVAPSADGSGTNALARTPPDAIAPHFGPGSCERHVREAQAKRLSHLVLPTTGFAADIDTAEDVERFLSLGRPCRTATLLRQFFEARRGVAVCS